MPCCIYCQEERPATAFTKAEHVLSQAFGTYQQNFTLHGVVCDDCNQYFGNHLELALGRDTFEGQLRFTHGVKTLEQFKSMGRGSRVVLKSTEGRFAGCYMRREYSAEKGDIIVKPLPQVGFLIGPDDRYEYFLLHQIPTAAELERKGFQSQHPHPIIGLEVDVQELTELLKIQGITFNYRGPLPPGERPDTILCDFEGTIDHVIFRAIAKIAFNYLAFWLGADFVQHPNFDRARRYIRFGEHPGYKMIQMDERAILEAEPIEGLRSLGHLITLSRAQDGCSVLAQVSLFNWMTYRICLARDFTGPRPELLIGHLFNVSNGEILELGARPAVPQTL
jgi:hypothetical protein